MTTTPKSNTLRVFASRKPICLKCGTAVARPVMVGEQLRGDCHKCGRVDAEWVSR